MKRSRRGNSKNLVTQGGNENKLDGRRRLRSTKSSVDVEKIESSDGAKTTQKRLNLSRFLFKNKEDRPDFLAKIEHDSDDFETPVKKIKRAPKLSQQPTISNRNVTSDNCRLRKGKRQQKITTSFMRSEQMFSEIAAQHALSDNLNPDDVQLALALSRSELETNIENSQESAVSAGGVDVCMLNAPVEDDIRSKLQKFGYRTGNKEAYSHNFVAAFLNNQSRTKRRWANKFTALTLRDPKIQDRKLNEKIGEILQKQFATESEDLVNLVSDAEPYKMQSNLLRQYAVVDKEALRLRNAEMLSTVNQLDNFFVSELFPVTHLLAGHLLKDWAAIAGRDDSPEQEKSKGLDARALKRKYECFYNRLETCFSKEKKERSVSPEHKASIEVTSLSQANEGEVPIFSETVSTQTTATPELKTVLHSIFIHEEMTNGSLQMIPTETEDAVLKNKILNEQKFSISQDRQHKTSNVESNDIHVSLEMSKTQTEQSFEVDVSKNEAKKRCSTEMLLASSLEVIGAEDCLNTQLTQIRPTSPDLFADSDSECPVAVESNQLTDITTYEVYSSDEVKTSYEVSHTPEMLSVKADNIDLTQDSDEFASPNNKKQNVSKRLDFLDISEEMKLPSSLENEVLENKDTEPFNDLIACVDLFHQIDHEFNDGNKEELKDYGYNESKKKISIAGQENNLRTISNESLIYDEANATLSKVECEEFGIQPLNDSIASIDLTQSDHASNDGYKDDDDDDGCILLSDDEVNYSIKKANRKSLKFKSLSSQSSLASSSSSENSFNNVDMDDNPCMILSDDEVNYSIKKSTVKTQISFSHSRNIASKEIFNESNDDYEELENRFRKAVEYNFSVLDLIDLEKTFSANEQNDEIIFPKNASFDFSGDVEPILKECLSTQYEYHDNDCLQTPMKEEVSMTDMMKNQRAEFGILESQSEILSPTNWTKTLIKDITPPTSDGSHQKQRFSIAESSKNFQNYNCDIPTTPKPTSSDVLPMEFDDFDEFDRLVYGSPVKYIQETQAQCNVPTGLSQLLTAEISFNARSSIRTPPRKCYSSPSPSTLPVVEVTTPDNNKNEHRSISIRGAAIPEKEKQQTSNPIGVVISPEKAKGFTYDQEEVIINDHVYIVRRTNSPEPKFSAEPDDQLIKKLANFGIKPLKRNLAIKFLKYIYDETHPIIDIDPNENDQMDEEIVCNKKTASKKGKKGSKPQLHNQIKKFDLQDCTGDKLLRYTTDLYAELRDNEEIYIFQTNVRKNTQRPLLPLHIAWFNLVCSSNALYESMLMYDPIDLQEIFLFFKSIGYRYDPKQLKCFFDRRCIIFRYDLNPIEKPGNHYSRKTHKKNTANSQKLPNSQQINTVVRPLDTEQMTNSQKLARPQKTRKFKKYTSSQQTKRSKKIPSSQPTLQKYLSL